MRKDTLLIEIGTEELPPKALRNLSESFTREIESALRNARLNFGECKSFASPRRLTVCATECEQKQADRKEQRKGPAVAKAYDEEGKPSKAALGFARSCGVEVDDLSTISNDKGEQWLAYEQEVSGESLANLVAPMVESALAKLPIPKRMRWGDGETEFVRPVHWVVVMYGTDTVSCEIMTLSSGNTTHGHRFLSEQPIKLQHANEYESRLETEGKVIADFAKRKNAIARLIGQAAEQFDATAVTNDSLLDEVTALVEWPTPIVGVFDEKFLTLPEEALIASMQDHQKYFPLRGADGRLTNRFVAISNIESTSPEVVQYGNERVIRPRLADADFFFTTDRERRLDERYADLARVTFERRLGSLLDKTKRVELLAQSIASKCGAVEDDSARAAALSRCDLLTDMVGEFPELQGVMGAYYAELDGENEAVQRALGEFYQPRFAGDAIAASNCGRSIAIADRIDTLVGIFGIGSQPTGDKDPYALRRAALGVLRTLIEGEIDLDLEQVLLHAREGFGDVEIDADTTTKVFAFMQERLRGYFVDNGYAQNLVSAVLNVAPVSPLDAARRLEAVSAFESMEEADALAAANKRISNLLRKHDGEISDQWHADQLTDSEEIALAEKLQAVSPIAEQYFRDKAYTQCLATLAELRSAIDAFFDEVMVMAEDATLRENRLALLASIQRQFHNVADIAELNT